MKIGAHVSTAGGISKAVGRAIAGGYYAANHAGKTRKLPRAPEPHRAQEWDLGPRSKPESQRRRRAIAGSLPA